MLDRSISKQYRWKVKSRLAVLEYVNVHGLKPTAARFGLDRKTIRAWRDRARAAGPVGLVPPPEWRQPNCPRVGSRRHNSASQCGEPIRRYVNKRLAHLDRAEFKDVPTFADLDEAPSAPSVEPFSGLRRWLRA